MRFIINQKICIIILLSISLHVSAVSYIYPNTQSGFTLWTAGSDLTNGNTLSFNGSQSIVYPTFLFRTANETASHTLGLVTNPSTIQFNASNTNFSTFCVVINNGNFTWPAGLHAVQNASVGIAIGLSSSTGSSTSAANLLTMNGSMTTIGGNNENTTLTRSFSISNRSGLIGSTGQISGTASNGTNLLVVEMIATLSGCTTTNNGTIQGTQNSGSSGTTVQMFDYTEFINNGSLSLTNASTNGRVVLIQTSSRDATFTNTGTVSSTNAMGIQAFNSSRIVTINMHGGSVTGGGSGAIVGSGTTNLNFANNATTTINGNISAITTLSVANGATASINGNTSGTTINIAAGGTAVFNGTVVATNFSNANLARMLQTFTPSNITSFTNTGTIAFDGNSAALGSNFTGSGAGSVVFGHTTPTTNFNLSSIISNFPTVTINSGSTVTFSTGAGFSSVTTLNVNGTLVNDGTFSIPAGLTVAGTGAIMNNHTKTLTLAGGSFSGAGTITNNGNIAISANTSMTSKTLSTSNQGSVTVSGQRTLSAAQYNNQGAQNHTITDGSTYDSLTCSCPINLANATVNVTSSFSGDEGGPWTIIQGSSLDSTNTTVNLPTSSGGNIFDVTWSKQFTATSLIISRTVGETFESVASGTVNSEIASVLQGMANNITNPAQQELVDIFFSIPTASEFNDALNQMIPLQNSSGSVVQLQNSVFNRIETRLAALQYDYSPAGYTAGDIDGDTAIWVAPFGSMSRQYARGDNAGYKSKAAGFLVGVDFQNWCDSIFGIGFGISNTSVNDESNSNFNTKILGYNALIYGSCKWRRNCFYEWLLTGSYNDNSGSRNILIVGNNLSTVSSFHNFQVASRLNLGKNYNICHTVLLSPVGMLQYAYINQPIYAETGSVAALNVSQPENKNIITLGAGLRLSFMNDSWWTIGARQLRAMVTYDALNNTDTITSSFVAGSSDFILATSPARLALKLGVDFSFEIATSFFLDLSYDYQVRQQFYDNTGMLKFKYVF